MRAYCLWVLGWVLYHILSFQHPEEGSVSLGRGPGLLEAPVSPLPDQAFSQSHMVGQTWPPNPQPGGELLLHLGYPESVGSPC